MTVRGVGFSEEELSLIVDALKAYYFADDLTSEQRAQVELLKEDFMGPVWKD